MTTAILSQPPAPSDVDLIDAALSYGARGWSIIPIGEEKKPAGPWKAFQTERADETTLRKTFARRGITGLAVVLGRVSGGLACRDFDREDSYAYWSAAHPAEARSLPTVRTACGYHVYFRGPTGFAKLSDGEYRGDVGFYCILPPSIHPAGPRYTWNGPLPGALPIIDPDAIGLRRAWSAESCNTTDTADSANTPHPTTLFAPVAPVVLQAIESTLPTRLGVRNRQVFELCRKLKAIPSLAFADLPTLRPIVVEWHRRALPIISTKEFSETWADFIIAWPKAAAADRGIVEAAFERAVASKPPPKAAALYAEAPVLLLASLCRELQRATGTNPFFLDCRTAGELIGVHHATAWRLLTTVLTADGILTAGARGSQATRKANEYSYVAD